MDTYYYKKKSLDDFSSSIEPRGEVLFFSLDVYLNELFMSKNLKDLTSFFSYFNGQADLYKWIRWRPKSSYNMMEVEGNKDVVVVISTPNFQGRMVENCVKEIYKGLHLILVGGEGMGNSFFNPAHNFNIGVKKAIEYNPKWVVISSDDMYKIDNVRDLVRLLDQIDAFETDVVFTKPAPYHSIPVKFAQSNFIRKLAFNLISYRRLQLGLESKFKILCFPTPKYGKFRLLFKKGYEYTSMADFGIFSGKFSKKMGGNIFDESFPIGGFDDDLSIRTKVGKHSVSFIDYKIGDMMGSTLGNDSTRKLRDLAGLVYLNMKYKGLNVAKNDQKSKKEAEIQGS